VGRRGTTFAQNVLKEMVKTALRFVMFARYGLHSRIPSLRFGRRRPFTFAMEMPASALADDARLFLTTFAGGLLFMSVYLA
jgi:hypothetical protein